MEWDKEIVKIAQEISNLKQASDSLDNTILMTLVLNKLEVVSTTLWSLYYYNRDEEGKEYAGYNSNPAHPVYYAIHKATQYVRTGLASGQFLVGVDKSRGREVEGTFKRKSRW